MKKSKTTTHPTHSLEECGVWLDLVQLKEKVKQKRLVRPISKLLNPLAKGEGYSLAVALNFTQTKMEMPKTKQSIISTFFTPHQRVINKMSSSGLQNFDPVVSSNASETKQGDGSSLQKANLDECGVAHEQESKRFTETGQLSPFLDETEEEMAEDFKPPPSKKRLVEKPLLLENSEAPPQVWSQDPLFNCDQYSESQIYQTDENFTTPKCLSGAEMAFFDGLRSEDAFGSVMDVKGRTSTQKPDFTSSISEDEEDDRANGSKSRRSTVSHFKSNCKQSETENILHQKQSSEPDENTMANLFTQDSEGFRVISHRGRQPRSPLRDQSNLVTGMVRTCKSFQEEDDDEEMLFTQDSQGNLVIKH